MAPSERRRRRQTMLSINPPSCHSAPAAGIIIVEVVRAIIEIVAVVPPAADVVFVVPAVDILVPVVVVVVVPAVVIVLPAVVVVVLAVVLAEAELPPPTAWLSCLLSTPRR